VYQDTKKALDTTEMKARFYTQGLAAGRQFAEAFATAMKARLRSGRTCEGAQHPRPVKIDLHKSRRRRRSSTSGREAAAARCQAGLRRASESRDDAGARRMLGTMIRNISVAEGTDNLLCQDTGIPIYNVWIGRGVEVDGRRAEAGHPARLRALDARILVPLVDRDPTSA